MTTRRTPAAITGTVRHVHDTGRIVAVELDTAAPGITGLMLIDQPNGRRAALRWQPGDHVTGWGWGPPPATLATTTLVVIRCHTVQRSRPGHPARITDPTRRLTPRQRNTLELARIRTRLDQQRAHQERRRHETP